MTTDLRTRVREGWQQALRGVLQRARALGPQAALAFDLDSTVLDNRARNARIFREFGQARAQAQLSACEARHWESGFDMRGAMRNCGLSDADVEGLYPEVRAFWFERFFTSEYCVDDVAIEGAAAFTQAVVATGAHLVYVTGRHEGDARGHRAVPCAATAWRCPARGGCNSWMKPHARATTTTPSSATAHARLGALGTVIAAFDNEPTHANDYLQPLPGRPGHPPGHGPLGPPRGAARRHRLRPSFRPRFMTRRAETGASART